MSQPSSYVTPWLKLDIDYEENDDEHSSLKPYRLTIHSSLNYNINTRWVLYHSDISCIEQLHWLLRATPPIIKDHLKEKFRGNLVSPGIPTKLGCLIERYKKVEVTQQPSSDASLIHGVYFTKEPFVPADSIPISIESFISKVVSELEDLVKIRVDNIPMQQLPAFTTQTCRNINDFLKFLHRHCEDFYVFLRFFRDLSKYLLVREGRTSVYRLEVEQLNMLKQSLKYAFKNVFTLLHNLEIQCLYYDAIDMLLRHTN